MSEETRIEEEIHTNLYYESIHRALGDYFEYVLVKVTHGNRVSPKLAYMSKIAFEDLCEQTLEILKRAENDGMDYETSESMLEILFQEVKVFEFVYDSLLNSDEPSISEGINKILTQLKDDIDTYKKEREVSSENIVNMINGANQFISESDPKHASKVMQRSSTLFFCFLVLIFQKAFRDYSDLCAHYLKLDFIHGM